MSDPVAGPEPMAPDGGGPRDENAPEDAGRASAEVADTLPKALAFGVAAATLQMLVLLALLYC